MWFLTAITYLAILVQILFVTISIAAGLYYLAELVEEYSSVAKSIIWWMNTLVTGIYVLFWLLEDFPFLYLVLCGLLAQIAHFLILENFPYVSFQSPGFVASVILLLINHYLALQFFGSKYFHFSEVIAFFTLCLWLVPFSLFVSVSANDNVLPTTMTGQQDGDVVSNYFMKKNKRYGLLSFFNYAKESLLPTRTKKGF